MTMRIAISAGEVSGDQHLSRVVQALRLTNPTVEFRGMAGRACGEAGAEILIDCYRKGGAMGFSEIVRSARGILESFRTLASLLETWRPHLLILVDYPDFNLRLAKRAKKLGIPVLYFVPPKVWAWRPGRVETIKRYVDHVAAIFPFEPEFYAKHGFSNVTYVGHPLADADSGGELEPSQRDWSLLMLPGSRKFEVERILPPMLRVFGRVAKDDKDLKGVVVAAPNMKTEWLIEIANANMSADLVSRISWRSGDVMTEMRRAAAGILKSGTCNLEGALAGLPFVSVYSGSHFSNVIVTLMVPLKEYSPVNIIRSKTVKEQMEVKIDETGLEHEVRALLYDEPRRTTVTSGLREVRNALVHGRNGDDTSGHDSISSGQEVAVGRVARGVARIALDLIERGMSDVSANS